MKGRGMWFLLWCIAPFVLTNCASLTAYPERSIDPQAEIQALEHYLQPSAITRYESDKDQDRNGLSRQAWRNAVVNARIRAIDLHFNAFQQGLFQEGIGLGIATDWSVLALNVAGTLTGGVANVLAAASAGVVGARAAFDKNAFFEKSMLALLTTMVAKRKDVLVRIREGLTKSLDEYPLTLALHDLESYYQVGTIPGAILEVAEAAGATAKKADARLESLLIVKAVPADLQVRRENIATYIKTTLNARERDSLAQALRLPTGDTALVHLLRAVAQAESASAIDVLAQQIKALFGREF